MIRKSFRSRIFRPLPTWALIHNAPAAGASSMTGAPVAEPTPDQAMIWSPAESSPYTRALRPPSRFVIGPPKQFSPLTKNGPSWLRTPVQWVKTRRWTWA